MFPRRRRSIVILLFVVGIIAVILVLFLSRINTMLVNLTRIELEALIDQQPDRVYDIHYDSLIINIYSGDVRVVNFSLSPRQQVLDSLSENNIPREHILAMKVGDFRLEGLEVTDFLLTGEIELEGLLFSDVEGFVYVNDTLENEVKTTVGNDILSDNFVSATIHRLMLTNGSFSYFNTVADSMKTVSFENFNLQLDRFYSDSAMIQREPGMHLEELHFSLEQFGSEIKDYLISSERFTFSSTENRYTVYNFSMEPKESAVMSQKYMDIKVGQVDLIGINYDTLIERRTLLANKIFIDQPNFRYVRPPQKLQKDTIRELPAQTFRKIPIPLHIDTLQIQAGYFNYYKHGYGEPTVEFDMSDINVNGYGFSSDPELMDSSRTFRIGGDLKFFGEAPVHMDFSFPMTDPYNSYEIDGRIGKIQAETLNSITKNTFMIRSVSGIFHEMVFNIQGNDTLARGDFSADYENLKMESLQVNEKDFTDVKRKGFNSFLINTLTKKNNDPARSSFTTGIIYQVRDDHMTYLDYNLSALLSGLLTSVVPETRGFIVPKEERKEIRQQQKE